MLLFPLFCFLGYPAPRISHPRNLNKFHGEVFLRNMAPNSPLLFCFFFVCPYWSTWQPHLLLIYRHSRLCSLVLFCFFLFFCFVWALLLLFTLDCETSKSLKSLNEFNMHKVWKIFFKGEYFMEVGCWMGFSSWLIIVWAWVVYMISGLCLLICWYLWTSI